MHFLQCLRVNLWKINKPKYAKLFFKNPQSHSFPGQNECPSLPSTNTKILEEKVENSWEMGSLHLRTTRWSGSASLWARWVTALPFHGEGVHTNQRNSTAKRFDEEKTAQSYFTTLIQFVNQRQILKLAYFSTIKCEYKTDPNVYMNFQITLTCGYKLQRRTSTTCCFSMRQVIDRWVNQHSMLSAFSKKPGATLIEWN